DSLGDAQLLADLSASFQVAVVEVLVRKTIAAARATGTSCVTLSGGVSCNESLRTQLAEAARVAHLKFLAAPRSLSTDNAAMIAFAAQLRLQNGARSSVTEEIDPNLPLA
ncbi:MAG: tRNA (adenosine(37)-N6)-threonylcarbamoyltransferase complex transferase subunit TsaD, partial [Verrucomicrobiota bacterium]|nr:tRNA (adenosine(37)-N6)-threonylcarbamoyltransferase complex transferase subunit TsaD [Verrucomicrobiota bacterium]